MRIAAIAPAVALLVALTACGGTSDDANTGDGGAKPSRPAATSAEYTGVAMWCGALDRDQFAPETTTSITADQLKAQGCNPAEGGTYPEGALVVVPSGVDRQTMKIASQSGSKINVDVDVPGPECATTMEFRGDMVLVIGSTSPDPALPIVKLNTVDLPC